MIDLQTFILPNIDNGPRDVQTFTNMARSLVKKGVHSVVATPLFWEESDVTRHELILYASAANDWLEEALIPLRVLPGQLVPASPQLLKNYEKQKLLTLNHTDKYLLMSLPYHTLPTNLDSVLYDLQLQGIVPILQAPERHPVFQQHPDKLYGLVKKGFVTQLSAGSILGLNGKQARKSASTFIKHRLAHVIASGVDKRTYWDYSLSKAYDVISDQYGTGQLYTFMENAEAVIEGMALEMEEPEAVKRGKIFKLWA
ncbi:tyrosine-protein phosphatase [Priestia flexa]|uniref:tyrosine-protein phosphatase n=1 Tax=Priestia flexa TaxID=86664 RepID=UPI00119FCBD5|nr:CpsB/CapC family capsule biosynthesis tyrosine phosphatase [Priestia flexa]